MSSLHLLEPLEAGPEPLEVSAVPLSRVPPGRLAIVEQVDPTHPFGRRLLDLGFVPSTRIRVVRRAPLGDPVSYEVRGTQLCLRASEAQHVWVRVLEAGHE